MAYHGTTFVEDPKGLDRVLSRLEENLGHAAPWSGFLSDISDLRLQGVDAVALLQLLLDRGQTVLQCVFPPFGADLLLNGSIATGRTHLRSNWRGWLAFSWPLESATTGATRPMSLLLSYCLMRSSRPVSGR
jgi:hypothetical protein